MVTSQRTWQMSEGFWNALTHLSNIRDKGIIITGIESLAADPSPNNPAVKIMRKVPKDNFGLTYHRMRKGNFRIFYTYNNTHIYLRNVAPKSDLDSDEDYIELVNSSSESPMINEEFLQEDENFAIPDELNTRQIDNGEVVPTVDHQLLYDVDVPEHLWVDFMNLPLSDLTLSQRSEEVAEWAENILEYLTAPKDDPLTQTRLIELPDGFNTLKEILSGKVNFEDLNLQLSEEQKKAVNYAFDAEGPVLIRGSAGTGKSLVAQYRVKKYIEHIGQRLIGGEAKILFTTFTHALKEDSILSLNKILGEKVKLVECNVTDQVIANTFRECSQILVPQNRITDLLKRRFFSKQGELDLPKRFCEDAKGILTNILRDTNLLNKHFKSEEIDFLNELSGHYIAQEIESVIYGHQILSLRSYFDHKRTGRRHDLNSDELRTIWKLKEVMEEEKLSKLRKMTFAQLHSVTAKLLSELMKLETNWRKSITTYDAIIVDEGQDLSPVTLAILMNLVENPNRLFVVADSTQAIFRAGDTNLEGYEGLNFKGRVIVLDKGYRTTEQVAKAATSYLEAHNIACSTKASSHNRNGPLPRLWNIIGSGEELLDKEIDLIASEIGKIHKARLDQVAIFTSSSKQCEAIVERLKKKSLKARTYRSKTYQTKGKQEIRVMPLQSVKGIEFPIVYIAGLQEDFPRIPSQITDGGLHELLEEHCRYLYVGMTRAISLLTVCVPQYGATDISTGFDKDLWKIETK